MKLNYKSLNELVYEYLYAKINSGALKPNEKIYGYQICKDLNVSRTPIREALIHLENEGFLERLPRRGFRVKEIKIEKIREIYEIIGTLEGLAANRSIGKIKKDDIKSMQNLTQKMDDVIKKKNRHEYFRLQRIFHNLIITACGNKELFDLINSLKKRFIKKAYYKHENEDVLYKGLMENNKQHKELISLIEKGDKEGAEKFLREVHWNFSKDNIVVSSFESSNSTS